MRRHGRSRRLEQNRKRAPRPAVGRSLAHLPVGFAGADAQTPGRRILRRWPLQRVPWGCLVLVCCSNRPRTRFFRREDPCRYVVDAVVGRTIRFSMKNSIMRSGFTPLWPRSGPTCTSKLLPASCKRLDELHHVRRVHVVVRRAVVQQQPALQILRVLHGAARLVALLVLLRDPHVPLGVDRCRSGPTPSPETTRRPRRTPRDAAAATSPRNSRRTTCRRCRRASCRSTDGSTAP